MEPISYFSKLLEAIEIKVNELIPQVKDVKMFSGIFNKDKDYKEATTSNPILKIGLNKLNPMLNTNSNQLEVTMDLSILFITKDETIPNSRYSISLNFLEQLLLLVKDGSWGIENTYATDASSVTAQNYSRDLEEIWQVNWKQKCILGTDRFEETGSFPTSWKANIDINKDGNYDEEYEGKVDNE